LADVRDIFGQDQSLSTNHILESLHNIEDAPWGDIKGKALDSRGLSHRLKKYGAAPKLIRVGSWVGKGYTREDLHDAWSRYLPQIAAQSVPHIEPVTSVARDYTVDPLTDDEFPGVSP
jgi:hypothetical protein